MKRQHTDQRPAVGFSQEFVLGRGFKEVGGFTALNGHDGSLRLFAELTADPDRPDVHPQEAYLALLSAMQPGWTLRLLQIFWPDPGPRQAFAGLAQGWQCAHTGLNLLKDGLVLFTQTAPLPFSRRTILEFVYPGEEGLAWWSSLGDFLRAYGLRAEALDREAVAGLARWTLNLAVAE